MESFSGDAEEGTEDLAGEINFKFPKIRMKRHINKIENAMEK